MVKMNKVELLKAKLDFDKTWSTILMAATLTSAIGYWANRTNQLASWGFAFMAIAFAFVSLFFIYQYQARHNELIDELTK